jgi:hypothetical protein
MWHVEWYARVALRSSPRIDERSIRCWSIVNSLRHDGRMVFRRRNVAVVVLLLVLVASRVFAESVYLEHDRGLPQAVYAAGRLAAALEERGYQVAAERGHEDWLIKIGVIAGHLEPEAYAIVPEDGRRIVVNGGDGRGILYGSLALAETVRNGARLEQIRAADARPRLAFRAIKHNLPWDAYRTNPALTQHYDTVRDLEYWRAFLDMMAANRFNALTLWNLHPFTYMIRPKNFPEASPFDDAELARWQTLYHGIFRMARERGIDTYIVNWNIFVSREFAEAHGVASTNFYPEFYTNGDRSDIVKRYIRESVTQVLEEYPDLSGFGVSYGEGMGGMTPQERQDWMTATVIEGMKQAKRPSKFINRVPFSATNATGGSTNATTEQLTRAAMETLGDTFDGPIWIEMKFNWSHGHSTPTLVKVHGGPIGDTYFVPEPKNYKVAWMVRNEDFWALRWGVPDFIRRHIALNGGKSYIGGYFVGSEGYIPALDYFTAGGPQGAWRYAFERQWLFYALWGRLLYDPSTPDETFQREFVRRYGERARPLLQAYSLASSTPLRFASFYDSMSDLTLYSEGFLATTPDPVTGRSGPVSYIGVERMIAQPTLDPDYVSTREYVDARAAGRTFTPNRITPPALADTLERDCREALRLVAGIDVTGSRALMYEVADVKTWANLGLHLAEQIRGAVSLATYRAVGGETEKQDAVRHLENALAFWDEVVAITRPIYKDMAITPYVQNGDKLFHWEYVRPEVAADIENARRGK